MGSGDRDLIQCPIPVLMSPGVLAHFQAEADHVAAGDVQNATLEVNVNPLQPA
jgi:hypothetical protein